MFRISEENLRKLVPSLKPRVSVGPGSQKDAGRRPVDSFSILVESRGETLIKADNSLRPQASGFTFVCDFPRHFATPKPTGLTCQTFRPPQSSTTSVSNLIMLAGAKRPREHSAHQKPTWICSILQRKLLLSTCAIKTFEEPWVNEPFHIVLVASQRRNYSLVVSEWFLILVYSNNASFV